MLIRLWLLPPLLSLLWLPWWHFEREAFTPDDYVVHFFEDRELQSMAVVTPDPLERDGTWRAEVLVRVDAISVADEIFFRSDTIRDDTLTFIRTTQGLEIHVHAEGPDDVMQPDRWLVFHTGMEKIGP